MRGSITFTCITGRFGRTCGAIAVIVGGTCPLLAHDFWIEPSSYRPKPGAAVELRLRVGEHFAGDALPRNPALIGQFIAAGPEGTRPIVGRAGMDPAGRIKIGEPGLTVVGYRSRHSRVELTPDAFQAYLIEEGLDHLAGAPAIGKTSRGVVRELFSRCAKSLLAAGAQTGAGHDRVLGFTLELIPEENPYSMRVGAPLPLRLQYEGQPLKGALVVGMNSHDPARKVSARSDIDGRASLRLSRGGPWLIKAVHMIPAGAGSGADWESLWASLTFELPRAAATRRGAKREL